MITSLTFFIILSITTLLFWSLTKQSHRALLLTLFSLIFLFLSQPSVLLTLIPVSILSYLSAIQLGKQKNTSKRILLYVSVSLLVLLLLFYKAPQSIFSSLRAIFMTGSSSGIVDSMIYPLGLSYLVFRVISFLADVYWEKIEPGSFLNYLSYISVFTIYTAGPIERYTNYKPQIEKQAECFSSSYFEFAIYRISIGLFKKIVLANWIGYYLLNYRHLQRSASFESLDIIGLCIFSFQIYFDFAGYSDIAIGSSKLFGITVMENFTSPFTKPNISKFWQSWHISLSSWIRDYIFYPLSMASFFRRIDFQITKDISLLRLWNMTALPVIAFTICGLWHGITLGFIIWGAMHGLALAVYSAWNYSKNKYNLSGNQSKILYALGMIITFLFVSISWQFFL